MAAIEYLAHWRSRDWNEKNAKTIPEPGILCAIRVWQTVDWYILPSVLNVDCGYMCEPLLDCSLINYMWYTSAIW